MTKQMLSDRDEAQYLLKAMLENRYLEAMDLIFDHILSPDELREPGVTMHGESKFVTADDISRYMSLLHEKQKTSDVHFIFVPSRRYLLSRLLYEPFCFSDDIAFLFNRKSEKSWKRKGKTYVKIYEFNLNKKRQKAMVYYIMNHYIQYASLIENGVPQSKIERKLTQFHLRFNRRAKEKGVQL